MQVINSRYQVRVIIIRVPLLDEISYTAIIEYLNLTVIVGFAGSDIAIYRTVAYRFDNVNYAYNFAGFND